MLSAITAAQRAGARLAPACRIVGISARTVERWRGKPGARTLAVDLECADELAVHAFVAKAVPQLATKGYTSPPNRPYTACSGATASEKSLET